MRRPKRLVISAYDPAWPALYERERQAIEHALGERLIGIEHVGSTAVPGLGAKPIVDIMAGLPRLADADACITPLAAIGYAFVAEAMQDMPDDRYFERWSDGFEVGTEVAHLHLCEYGSPFWQRHLRFRDILRGRPDLALAYERLKRELAPQYTSGAAYAAAKTSFIASTLGQASDPRHGATSP
jgi:GrpB-like predicted nucleotidyltransferase (UPF0157 family)